MESPEAVVLVAGIVGVLVGLTGVGAGAAMTPALIGFFGVPVPVAIATDLIFATVTKTIGALAHGKAGQVDWKLARALWSGSIPAVVLGSLFLVQLVSQGSTTWLSVLLVAIVAFTSWNLLSRALARGNQPSEKRAKPTPPWLAPAGGAGLGLGVSLTSVGAGVLGMALLVRLTSHKTSPRVLVATDLVHAIPIALIAGLTYGAAGLVDFRLLGWLLLGSVPGVILGARLSGRMLEKRLNLILGLSLGALASTLFIQLW